MKLPLDQPLVDTEDAPAKDERGNTVTLRAALIRAVLSEFDDSRQPISGKDKLARYDLYKRIKRASGEADFTPEEVVEMRKAVLIYPPLTCGQICDLLT